MEHPHSVSVCSLTHACSRTPSVCARDKRVNRPCPCVHGCATHATRALSKLSPLHCCAQRCYSSGADMNMRAHAPSCEQGKRRGKGVQWSTMQCVHAHMPHPHACKDHRLAIADCTVGEQQCNTDNRLPGLRVCEATRPTRVIQAACWPPLCSARSAAALQCCMVHTRARTVKHMHAHAPRTQVGLPPGVAGCQRAPAWPHRKPQEEAFCLLTPLSCTPAVHASQGARWRTGWGWPLLRAGRHCCCPACCLCVHTQRGKWLSGAE